LSASRFIRQGLPGIFLAATLFAGCSTPRPGTFAPRKGDEIVVAGQFIHTGTRIVLWMDPGGYDAYRVERRFSPIEKSNWADTQADVKGLSPNRYNLRREGLSTNEIERVRGGGWDLPTLQKVVDRFVIHYDVCGTSRQCFKVLQDVRGLSVHFMLDSDGTIYQTLDLKERAWHATASNSRSIGIEIANIGAYPLNETNVLSEWYREGTNGQTVLTIPTEFGDGGIRTKGFVGHPARSQPVVGIVQGETLMQYDFTPEQYQALIHLTATLAKVFPKIKCDCPRDATGKVLEQIMPETELQNFQGVLGHFHVQTDKQDPGPAFQWDYVLSQANLLLHPQMHEAAGAGNGPVRRRF
jgi:N-acetyl-anhydromuramyl-L-alanine amidase AmpD